MSREEVKFFMSMQSHSTNICSNQVFQGVLKSLEHGELEKLNFDLWYDLGEEGLLLVADELKKSTRVKEASFKGCLLGPNGCLILGEVVKVNPTVAKLIFSNNDICEEGVRAIAEALKEAAGLRI